MSAPKPPTKPLLPLEILEKIEKYLKIIHNHDSKDNYAHYSKYIDQLPDSELPNACRKILVHLASPHTPFEQLKPTLYFLQYYLSRTPRHVIDHFQNLKNEWHIPRAYFTAYQRLLQEKLRKESSLVDVGGSDAVVKIIAGFDSVYKIWNVDLEAYEKDIQADGKSLRINVLSRETMQNLEQLRQTVMNQYETYKLQQQALINPLARAVLQSTGVIPGANSTTPQTSSSEQSTVDDNIDENHFTSYDERRNLTSGSKKPRVNEDSTLDANDQVLLSLTKSLGADNIHLDPNDDDDDAHMHNGSHDSSTAQSFAYFYLTKRQPVRGDARGDASKILSYQYHTSRYPHLVQQENSTKTDRPNFSYYNLHRKNDHVAEIMAQKIDLSFRSDTSSSSSQMTASSLPPHSSSIECTMCGFISLNQAAHRFHITQHTLFKHSAKRNYNDFNIYAYEDELTQMYEKKLASQPEVKVEDNYGDPLFLLYHNDTEITNSTNHCIPTIRHNKGDIDYPDLPKTKQRAYYLDETSWAMYSSWITMYYEKILLPTDYILNNPNVTIGEIDYPPVKSEDVGGTGLNEAHITLPTHLTGTYQVKSE